ncbi:MAG: response regulator transcription factor [Sphaerochaetaceae bacterium]|nr:response regulator transcription factor [Sphaerochaetaceae bacterium]
MVRVIVVEDHLLFRKGLVSILEAQQRMQVVAEYANGQEFLNAVQTGSVEASDLIFLDIAMPWKSGLEVLQEVRERSLNIPPVCVLSMYPDQFYLEQVKALGARGYLTKDSDLSILESAVREIVEGRTFFLTKEKSQDTSFLENLSAREIEVFKLLTKGMTIKEIAYELDISVKSVSTYKTRLMEKLSVDSLTDLYKMSLFFDERS